MVFLCKSKSLAFYKSCSTYATSTKNMIKTYQRNIIKVNIKEQISIYIYIKQSLPVKNANQMTSG